MKETLKLALEAWEKGDGIKLGEILKEALAQPEYQSTADKSKLEKVPAKGTLLAQPEQEPVAWRGYNWSHSPDDWVYRNFDDPILDGNGNNVGQPLYTTPPQRKPLTDEQIAELCRSLPATQYTTAFARAIEAAHGIKE